jgi:hypothetical protein
MQTFDQRTIDSTGAYLVGQLERLDPTLHEPLVSVTYTRDLSLRSDVTIGDESASFTQSSFVAANGAAGKGYIAKATSTVSQVGVDEKKVIQAMHLWARKASWTVAELASAMQLGRPIDEQKLKAIQMAWNMDLDKAAYIGDSTLGITGLFNNASVSTDDAPNGTWASATVDHMLADINELLNRAYANAAYAVCPTDLRLDPTSFGILVTTKVSDAGNISALEYIKVNCLSNAINGKPLNIQPAKFAASGQAVSNKNLMCAYTNDPLYVRFPVVPIQRQQMTFQDIAQSVSYLGRHGQVEFIYPETVAYSTNL